MVKVKGAKVYSDGTMIIHPDAEMKVETDSVAADSIKVPQVDTAYGAGFGDSINDYDRVFAVCREPVAHFITHIVAADIVDKWFVVDNPDTETTDPALDREVQRVLGELNFKRHLRDAIAMSRTFGKSLLVGGFTDAKTTATLKTKRRKEAKLKRLAVYPGIQGEEKVKSWTVDEKDENVESPRYGQPVVYKLSIGGGNYLYVHYTRVCEVGNGISELDKVWDDMNCGRNIRWGAAQWMYRTGGGFPVIGFPAGTTRDQLEEYHTSGIFRDLHSRTAIFIAQNSTLENDGMTFEFKGAATHALDPVPFLKSNLEQIAIATGYPQSKLIGAQAGAVTGSEVNQQDYYKAISRDQEELEDAVRWVIDRLAESGQITLIKPAETSVAADSEAYATRLLRSTVKRLRRMVDYRHRVADNYTVNWRSAFELNEVDSASVDLKRSQANVAKLAYMTPDEVRAGENLPPLANGEGEKLRPVKTASPSKEGEQPEQREKRETLAP